MNLQIFIERIINDGIEAAKADYNKPEDKDRLIGALEGFELCRGKNFDELGVILKKAMKDTSDAHAKRAPDYWKIRCREAEIEWVCNTVSAIMLVNGSSVIIQPTCRGMMKANEIVGTEGLLKVFE
jgi:hypothetical protein